MGYSAATPDGLLCFDAQASVRATRSPAGELASVRGNAAQGPFEGAAMQVGVTRLSRSRGWARPAGVLSTSRGSAARAAEAVTPQFHLGAHGATL